MVVLEWVGGRDPQQPSGPSVNHGLNEPGVLPPDAVWPSLRDEGRTVISRFSHSLSAWMPRWKPASLLQHPTHGAWWETVTRKSTHTHSSAWTVSRTETTTKLTTCKYSEIHEELFYWTCDSFTALGVHTRPHTHIQWDRADGMYHRLCDIVGIHTPKQPLFSDLNN